MPAWLALALLLPGPGAAQDVPPADGQIVDQGLFLAVFINGEDIDVLSEFRQAPDGSLLALPEDLATIGLKTRADALDPEGFVVLSRLPGVSYEYDEVNQALQIQASPASRLPRMISARGQRRDEVLPSPTSAWGAVLNYDVLASTASLGYDWQNFSDLHASGFFESRLFSPYGVVSSGAIGRAGSELDLIRTDTTWTYSDPESMRTYRAGDHVTSSLAWTRPVRMAGFQAERNFDLRDDLLPTVLPSVSGTAAVPSTVEVYVNDARTYTGTIPDGPFTITDLPAVSGGATTRLVVRDALGRETIVEAPFFASSAMLAPGAFDYSVEAGLVRRSFGLVSNDYDGRIAASGSARYGLRDWLTLEGHIEANEDLFNGAAGTVASVWGRALVSLGGAGSVADGDAGWLVSAGFETDLFGATVRARTRRTLGDYQDLASISSDLEDVDDTRPEAVDQISISLPLGFDPSSLGLSYSAIEFADGESERVAGASYSRSLPGNAHLFASGNYSWGGNEELAVFAGIRIPLGEDLSARSTYSAREDQRYSAEVRKTLRSEPGSIGWRLGIERGDIDQERASASYRSSVGEVEAGVRRSEAGTAVSASAEGAIVATGGGAFMSNRIHDAFAIVDAGAPGVTVYSQNREVGETGRGGKILVPDLAAHRQAEISIDQGDLPLTASIPSTNEVVVPREMSGVVIDFGVEETTSAALVEFRDESGGFIRPGAEGRIVGGDDFIVGYDGQAYITGLGPMNEVTIDTGGRGHCAATFPYRGEANTQGFVDNVICRDGTNR